MLEPKAQWTKGGMPTDKVLETHL